MRQRWSFIIISVACILRYSSLIVEIIKLLNEKQPEVVHMFSNGGAWVWADALRISIQSQANRLDILTSTETSKTNSGPESSGP